MSVGEGGEEVEWQTDRQTMERQAANFAKLPILLPGNEPTTEEGRKQDEMRARKEAPVAASRMNSTTFQPLNVTMREPFSLHER